MSDDLLRTPLHALHVELGARMTPFAGYVMPVQYPSGILQEHRHVRSAAGLFDVSHMGQIRLSGAGAAAALETLVPADIIDLAPGRQRYALLTAPDGGILDDLMISNFGDDLIVVVNAARKQHDLAHVAAGVETRAVVEYLPDHALLALQGPASGAVLARLAPGSAALRFMQVARLDLGGVPCRVSRSGYTGEDGFEISMHADAAQKVARLLLAQPEVAPIGLGARDTLRLEAGLCLYGHDIDATTSPVEAGLTWAVSRCRRPGGVRPGGYPGDTAIARQLAAGAPRVRVGLLPRDRAPLRDGTTLHEPGSGTRVGHITSGGFSPSLGLPVAMGYVDAAFMQPGTMVSAMLRGRQVDVQVAALPFVAPRYLR